MKRIFAIVYVCLLSNAVLEARPLSPVAMDAYKGTEPGARALGMGYAASAVGEDPASVYFNPAGLGRLSSDNVLGLTFEAARQSELTTDQIFSSERLKDTNLSFISLANAKGALSWRPLANYTSTTTTPSGSMHTTEARINAFTFSGTQTDDKVTNGLNLTYLAGRVAETGYDNGVPFANIADGNGIAIDYGMLLAPSPLLRLGLSAHNLFGMIWWDDYEAQQLPFTLRAGFAYQISAFSTFAYDYDAIYYRAPDSAVSQNHLGLEQNLGETLKLRIGIYGPDMNNREVTRYTAGIGYSKDKVDLDIGGERYRIAGADVYRIVFGLNFPL